MPVDHSSVVIAPVVHENDAPCSKWVLYASTRQPIRLVVFVHGFKGDTITSWNCFAQSGATSNWWRESDMLFVGYESLEEHPSTTANWLIEGMEKFYPRLSPEYLRNGDVLVREPSREPYRELLLVGHSLGGFVVRLALCQEASSWCDRRSIDPTAPRPPLLDATVRLFSPASAGFNPTGPLGSLEATFVWKLFHARLSAAPAYKALQQGSYLLESTRDDTERLIKGHASEVAALRAYVLWAEPEQIVERGPYYRLDYVDANLIPRRNHSRVCKPDAGYGAPRRFVETGRHR